MDCLGSAWTCAVCWITILSPSGDCVRGCSRGSGVTPMSDDWKAVKAALSRWWLPGEWRSVSTGCLVPVSWYTVNILFPIRRTYSPRLFVTDILPCIRAIRRLLKSPATPEHKERQNQRRATEIQLTPRPSRGQERDPPRQNPSPDLEKPPALASSVPSWPTQAISNPPGHPVR